MTDHNTQSTVAVLPENVPAHGTAVDGDKQTPNTTDNRVWYAIRVTYNREMKVKADLDAKGISCFIPMNIVYRIYRGRRVKKLVPSIHNLIFFHISHEDMKRYKAETRLPIRYIMNPATHKPVVVPSDQMDNFIAVAGSQEEKLIYLSPEEIPFKRGDKVRVMGGPFEGAVGELVRIKGDRRVVVEIEGVVAVATAYIHPSMLEKVKDGQMPKSPRAIIN